MNDLICERSALQQTKIIINKIDAKGMDKKFYRKLVLKIYDNQLKKFTNLNRLERHRRLKNLGIKRDKA